MVSPPQGREMALAWDRRLHFFVYEDRKQKFGTHIWRKIICIHVGWLSYGPQNGPFRGPNPPPSPFSKLFIIKIEAWNLGYILFISHGIQCYAWVQVSPPRGPDRSGPCKGPKPSLKQVTSWQWVTTGYNNGWRWDTITPYMFFYSATPGLPASVHIKVVFHNV